MPSEVPPPGAGGDSWQEGGPEALVENVWFCLVFVCFLLSVLNQLKCQGFAYFCKLWQNTYV